MADERAPTWVQLATEYLVTGPSGKGLFGTEDN